MSASAGSDANRLAAASLAAGDPTGWFDQLYREAAEGEAVVPWDSGEPHPLLMSGAADKPLVPAEIDRFSPGPLTEVSREQVEWRWRVDLTRI